MNRKRTVLFSKYFIAGRRRITSRQDGILTELFIFCYVHTKIPFSDFSNRSMVFLRFFNGIALSVINKSLLENTIPKYLHNISKRFERGASNGYFSGYRRIMSAMQRVLRGKGLLLSKPIIVLCVEHARMSSLICRMISVQPFFSRSWNS